MIFTLLHAVRQRCAARASVPQALSVTETGFCSRKSTIVSIMSSAAAQPD